jgi:hypothetical protein
MQIAFIVETDADCFSNNVSNRVNGFERSGFRVVDVKYQATPINYGDGYDIAQYSALILYRSRHGVDGPETR